MKIQEIEMLRSQWLTNKLNLNEIRLNLKRKGYAEFSIDNIIKQITLERWN